MFWSFFEQANLSVPRGMVLSMVNIRSPFKSDHGLEKLRQVHSDAGNILGSGNELKTIFGSYLKWVNESTRILKPLLSSIDMDRLVTTKNYWVLRAGGPDSHELMRFLSSEILERIQILEQEIKKLQNLHDSWRWENGYYIAIVADTNFLLDYHGSLATIDWHKKLKLEGNSPIVICIPMIVVDELDGLKLSNKNEHNKEPLRNRARKAIRMLEKTLDKPGERTKLPGEPIQGVENSEVYLTIFNDGPDHIPLMPKDAEIRDRAGSLKPFTSNVFVATIDTGMMFKCRSDDISVCKFEDILTPAKNSSGSARSTDG